MKISNPKNLLDRLDNDTYSSLEERFGEVSRFLGPGDKFRFSCDRSGQCCKNRSASPIILSPYDVFRIQKGLGINSKEFSAYFAEKVLGADSKLPMMILGSPQTNGNYDQCVFLDSGSCEIYENRPLVCRMYPVGRMVDQELNSYFFLTKTGGNCGLGKGREFTLEEWLEKADVEPYFKWNDKFHSLYMDINYEKYLALDLKYKTAFGEILYDFDLSEKIFPDDSETAKSDNLVRNDNSGPHLNYEVARMYVDRFLK
jgi:Fe-S-cluster containining protein